MICGEERVMLGFLFGLLIVVILVALAIAYREVRWALGIIAGVFFFGILAVVGYVQDNERRYKQQHEQEERQQAAQAAAEQAVAAREREAALQRVTPQELQFEDMSLGPLTYARQSLRGRAHNLATRYSVSGATLEITLKDCVGAKCEVVGTDYASLDFWIPPGQVRGVDATLTFKDLPPVRGTRRFDYQVTSISAQ
jgi:hypothetical protein